MTAFASDLEAFRAALVPALDDASLAHWRGAPEYAGTEHRIADHSVLTGLLYDGDWTRYGWPEAVGGLGGDERHRAVLYDALSAAGLPVPEQLVLLESVAPAVIRFAPELAATYLPRVLQGHEWWGRAFTDRDADGCRARRDGDRYVLSGRKTWVRHGATAKRLACLVRTGEADDDPDARTMLLVDVDTPGVSVRPVALASGHNELAEVIFDEAAVPTDRLVGADGHGGPVAQSLLPYERGQVAWLRTGVLLRQLRGLQELLAMDRVHRPPDGAHRRLGDCYSDVVTVRARSAATVRALAAGDDVGAGSSLDEALLGEAVTAIADLARDLLGGDFVLSPAPRLQSWRVDWWHSRLPAQDPSSAQARLTAVADHVLADV